MRVKKALIMIILLFPFVVQAGELNIVNIADNNYGSCVVLESNGKYLLTDNCLMGGSYLLNWLQRENVTSVDVYLSNYNLFGRIRFNSSLSPSNLKIDKFYLPEISGIRKYLTDEYKATNEENWNDFSLINEFYSNIVDGSRERGYEVVTLKTGDSFSVGDAKVSIIGPTKEFSIDGNEEYIDEYVADLSLVAMASIDGKKYLMLGSIGVNSANDLLQKNVNLKADIMASLSGYNMECEAMKIQNAAKPLFMYIATQFKFGAGTVNSLPPNSPLCDEGEVYQMTNIYIGGENGTVTFNIKDGVVSTKRCDNCAKVEINYIDKNSKKELGYYSSYYSTGKPYYLGDTKKEFKNYRVFTVNYEEIPVVINHKYDSNSDEAKVVMLVQKYVNDNLRSKLYLNNLKDWNALSVDYMGETKDGKEYYLKTAIDCAGDVKCIEDATDYDSNNNQYLYNAYVIVDGNSNVKLSFEKSSLVEDEEEEIGEGEVENPKTGSYISLFIILPTFVIILLIGFMVRKNKLYNIR